MNRPSQGPHFPTVTSEQSSFAETALEMGGKSREEVRRTGDLDRADDQVERLYRAAHQTAQSPIHQAVWERKFPSDLFQSPDPSTPAPVEQIMRTSLEIVRRRRPAGTLWGSDGKLSQDLIDELARVGYWGLLIDKHYGGAGASFHSFACFLSRMNTLAPAVAGIASVHGCIGAVDPLQTFGSAEQKQRLLPVLARGERLSGFALTEPGAGSDLTALRTRAVRDGDDLLISGQKMFITNAAPGRMLGLVCLLDDRPAVVIVELPEKQDDTFQLRDYGLHALRRHANRGIVFQNFRVPASNLLVPPRGDGLTIAYHGLNRGRVAICSQAAGVMRTMLASLIPWARERVTYGEPLAKRELVRRRLARLAGLIVAADALVHWCANLLDQGFRGEMECIVAKVFGSEAIKEAAIDLAMKSHGGRSFLHGHIVGDHLHDYLAPCIYEGEGELLGLAFFKSLVKQHGTTYFEPLGKALHRRGLKKLNPWHPGHWWAVRRAALPYARWFVAQHSLPRPRPVWPELEPRFRRHASFAARELRRAAGEISRSMRQHQLRLPDRQCRMSELSCRVQALVVLLVTALYGARQPAGVLREAADMFCRDTRRYLTGRRPSDDDFRQAVQLGASLAGGDYRCLTDDSVSERMGLE